jgi:hypothetical protein
VICQGWIKAGTLNSGISVLCGTWTMPSRKTHFPKQPIRPPCNVEGPMLEGEKVAWEHYSAWLHTAVCCCGRCSSGCVLLRWLCAVAVAVLLRWLCAVPVAVAVAPFTAPP